VPCECLRLVILTPLCAESPRVPGAGLAPGVGDPDFAFSKAFYRFKKKKIFHTGLS